MIVNLLLGLLPDGPQKDAATKLSAVLQANPAALAILTAHVAKLPDLIGAVRAGQKTVAGALTEWLDAYQRLPGLSEEVRTAILGLIDSVAKNPEATNTAVGPTLTAIGPFLGGGS